MSAKLSTTRVINETYDHPFHRRICASSNPDESLRDISALPIATYALLACLSHLPLVPHIYIYIYIYIYAFINWVTIGSGDGLSSVRRQALSVKIVGSNFSEI